MSYPSTEYNSSSVPNGRRNPNDEPSWTDETASGVFSGRSSVDISRSGTEPSRQPPYGGGGGLRFGGDRIVPQGQQPQPIDMDDDKGDGDTDMKETPAPRRVGKYELGETIGVGGYSKVKLGRHVDTGLEVALKIMGQYKLDEKTRRHLLREIAVMKTVKHENVLKLIEFFENADYPEADGTTRKCAITVLEYAPCGELFDYLMFTGAFGELATRTYTHQMMSGLHAMHKKGFAHRDLKPENLLLDASFTLKIADFGFARSFVDAQDIIRHMETTCGTKGYLAPEVLQKRPYTYKADLFTMGIIIFTTYCAFPPFQEAVDTDWWWKRLSKGILYLEKSKRYSTNGNEPNKAKQYQLQGIKYLTQFWDNHNKRVKIDQEFQELMINMLHPSPDRRFNHQQIRNHKWYQQPIMNAKQLGDYMRERVKKVNKSRKHKVEQMVRDRIANNPNTQDAIDISHVARAEGKNLFELCLTHLKWNPAQSNLFELIEKIDPNRDFLDNIEYEADMPHAGVRQSFYTLKDPSEMAARLQIATDNIGQHVPGTGDPSSPVPLEPGQMIIQNASINIYPKLNMSVVNCTVVINGAWTQKVAFTMKQYVRKGTRFVMPEHVKKWIQYGKPDNDYYDVDEEEKQVPFREDTPDETDENDSKSATLTESNSQSQQGSSSKKAHQNEWIVVISKLRGLGYAFQTAVLEFMSTKAMWSARAFLDDSESEDSSDQKSVDEHNHQNGN